MIMTDKILIVVDMQNDFVTGALGTLEAKAIVPQVVNRVKTALNYGDMIYFTRDTHFEHYLETLEGKYLPVEHCIFGTEGHDIIPELKGFLIDAKIVDKPTFGSMELVDRLSSEFVCPEIELCGVCTDICVISNVLLLRAAFPNSRITVQANLCAGTTPANHEAALAVMRSCQIDVI